MAPQCPHEEDVLDMVAARRWPGRCGEALAAHMRACRSCEDLATVAGAFLEDGEEVWQQARVPAPAVVWWRAQARAREEAARAAARPIAFAQGVAASCAIWAAVSLLRTFAGSLALPDWHDWSGRVHRMAASAGAIQAGSSSIPGLIFLMVVACALLLAPVALLVVWREVAREE